MESYHVPSGTCTDTLKMMLMHLKSRAFTSSNSKFAKVGALVKFTAPTGKVFDVH